MKILVSTRKGLFEVDRTDGWAVGAAHFLGDPVSLSLVDPRDGAWYAALKLGHFGVKLRRSDDRGATWTEVAAPAFPAGADGAGPSLSDCWALSAGGADQPGRLWFGSIPGGLFRSDDRGESWVLVESLWNHPLRSSWFGGGADEPGIHTVLVDPRDSARVLVAVSCGGVWSTPDDGATWEIHTAGMKADFMPPALAERPETQDPHRLARCAASPDVVWCQHHNAAYRSVDAGRTWAAIEPPPSHFGFAVVAHPTDPLTAWFVPAIKDEERIPVDGKVVVARTRDGGVTWQELRHGLPQSHAYDIVYRHAMDIDGSGDVLAFGSTTGSLWVSGDGGERWDAVSHHLPPVYAVAFVQG